MNLHFAFTDPYENYGKLSHERDIRDFNINASEDYRQRFIHVCVETRIHHGVILF